MPAESLNERISAIAADILEVPPSQIGPCASPETIANWDSVRHLNLVLAYEQEFDVQFEPEEIDELKSIAHIREVLAAKTGLKT